MVDFATSKKLKNLAHFSLTAGASLILGLLSFGGTYVLFPSAPLALAAFFLAVAYEGEIYSQNIKGAFKKLFRENTVSHQIKQQVVGLHLKSTPSPSQKKIIELLKAQEIQEHQGTKEEQKAIKRGLSHNIKRYLQNHPELQKTIDIRVNKVIPLLKWAKGFSILTAILMSLGTTYLLAETLEILPFISAHIYPILLPGVITSLSLISGIAYGFLTYNALHDMLVNDTLSHWVQKIRQDLKTPSVRSISMALMATILAALAVTLTLCTAGTWWTIVSRSKPALSWVGQLPRFVMGAINPIVTGLAAIIFNLQNTSETLGLIYQSLYAKESFWARLSFKLQNWSETLFKGHNIFQRLNPFRLLIKCVVTPARFICFMGHLVSIGVTADRVPVFSERTSATLGTVSECFEDFHYFFDEDHELLPSDEMLLDEMIAGGSSHSHESDLPSQAIQFSLTPVYGLAAFWDSATSQLNNEADKVSFATAYHRMCC